MYCPDCDFVWFADAYDSEEAGRLYSNYRGDEYNALRLKLEPGYSSWIKHIFNSFENEHYRGRIQWNREFFRERAIYPEKVLDFGGDGSIPKGLFNGAQVDYHDLSHGHRVDGGDYDLVFAAHVLEHVSVLKQLLSEIKSFLGSNSYCYVEVPLDYQGELQEAYFRQVHEGGALFLMHEHINHFSAKALQKAILAAGLVPVKCQRHCALNFLGVLCKLSSRPISEQGVKEAELVTQSAGADATPVPSSWEQFAGYAKGKGTIKAFYKAGIVVLEKVHRALLR
jgi:hypothetical protein